MKVSFILMGCLLAVGTAQAHDGLKGPQAKNHKRWECEELPGSLYVMTGAHLKGPEAKNTLPLERTTGELKEIAKVSKEALKGPKAKNQKVFRN